MNFRKRLLSLKPSLKCSNNSKSIIRVLCLILASAYESKQMAAIENTWARRCDKHFFTNGQTNNPQIAEIILNVPVPEERRHLTMKMRHAFKYVYRAYKASFDWILKCDTDTYVIMENLQPYYSNKKREKNDNVYLFILWRNEIKVC
ncbi:glycoprotein-N-acetylgalactosamine 3-beta-galactosyltransferase 1-like [Mercenaria mercenaria]|uniref:glycoprotein-N-acetylgalactosamine 3-beta-galactosyltransferase 1-like n=1 Tax=Mercenaria mercenaria TaxID=6596 RepID=UPI00234EFFC5|nr:glycoprotein-N-acetylgalactosamine 3-beta-galactosyltransferase 1-like [Mercenaria mercenaria]